MPRLSPDDPRLAASDFPHGTPSGYVYGCPCDNCRAAHRMSAAAYRRRNPSIKECPRVPTGPAVKHLKLLLKHTDGSLKPLARATGVSWRTLKELAGDPARPTRKYMQQQTRDAILAVTPKDAVAALPLRERSTGRIARARRNISELIDTGGCTTAMIATAAGVAEQAVLDVLADERVLQRVALALARVTVDACYGVVEKISARPAATRLRALQANWWALDRLSDLLGHDTVEIVGLKMIDPLIDEDVATLYARISTQIGPDADAAADSIGLGYYPPMHYDRDMGLITDSILGYGETAADATRQDRARVWFRIIGYTILDYPEADLVRRLETSSGVIQAARRKAGIKLNPSRGLLDPIIMPGQDEEVAVIQTYLRPIAIRERTDVVDEPLDYDAHWKAMIRALTEIRAKRAAVVRQSGLTRAA